MLIQEYVAYKIWESDQRLREMQRRHSLDGLELVAVRSRIAAWFVQLARLANLI